jgi:3-oxoacyl-[acyl-carrier protein] reductase
VVRSLRPRRRVLTNRRTLAEHLKASGSGNIVNIASVGGLLPGSSSIAYSCSNAALVHLTHCLAVAMAPDVRVNCVAPGLVEGTRMALRVPEAVVQVARSMAVLGRGGSTDDIANATVMFCQADTVTGQTLVVDGGLPMSMNFGISVKRSLSAPRAMRATPLGLASVSNRPSCRFRARSQT